MNVLVRLQIVVFVFNVVDVLDTYFSIYDISCWSLMGLDKMKCKIATNIVSWPEDELFSVTKTSHISTNESMYWKSNLIIVKEIHKLEQSCNFKMPLSLPLFQFKFVCVCIYICTIYIVYKYIYKYIIYIQIYIFYKIQM